jgi:hypothetical protein
MNLRDDEKLDQWLDRALREYGKAEPRRGLEGRILANLAIAEREVELRSTGQPRAAVPTFGRLRWRFGFAGLAAGATIVIAIWVGSGLRDHGKKTVSTSVPDAVDHNRGGALPPIPHAANPNHKAAVTQRNSIRVEAASALPRLDQFPSQRPLSEQEQLLKTYVSQFPKEAAVIAGEQEQREKELEGLYSDNRPNSDSEQER